MRNGANGFFNNPKKRKKDNHALSQDDHSNSVVVRLSHSARACYGGRQAAQSEIAQASREILEQSRRDCERFDSPGSWYMVRVSERRGKPCATTCSSPGRNLCLHRLRLEVGGKVHD